MIPSLDHSLHYRTAFKLELREDPIVVWNDLLRMVRGWIGARISETKSDMSFSSKWFFMGGEWRPKKSTRVQVRTERFDGTGQPELPEFWACRFEHPCSTVASRQWRTDIGISLLPDQNLLFSISTIHWLPPGYIGQPENPLPTAPRIVGQILNSKKLSSWAGSEKLDTLPFLLRDGQAQVLLTHLTSPQRTCPIVYVAKDFFTGDYLVNPYSLAKVLAGTAAVYMAESSWADKELEALLPQGFRCWNGMVRVFQPALNLEKDFDAKRHRYFRKEEIESIGNEAIEELLVRGIVRRSLGPRFSGVTTIEDIGQKKKEAHFLQLKMNAQSHKDTHAWAQLLEQDNEKLSSEIKQKDEEVKYWQTVAEQLDSSEDEVNRLRYELDTTLERARKSESVAGALAARASTIQDLENLPNSVLDVATLIEKLYPDRISFTERAKKSAAQASIGNFNVAWKCLRGMATILHELHFQKKLSLREIANQFRNRTGFELAIGESESTKSNKKLAALRKDIYKGEAIDISIHVKHGNSPGNILRVHYYSHPTEQRLIIGHCGDDLDTIKTN
jgi:hypothetical protein